MGIIWAPPGHSTGSALGASFTDIISAYCLLTGGSLCFLSFYFVHKCLAPLLLYSGCLSHSIRVLFPFRYAILWWYPHIHMHMIHTHFPIYELYLLHFT